MISPLARRLRLGTAIRNRRLSLGLTPDQLARLAGTTRTTISRIETGSRPRLPQLQDVIAVIDALQLPTERAEQMRLLASEGAIRGWWDDRGHHRDPRQQQHADLETGAASILVYQRAGFPPLLQTAEYAQARLELQQLDTRVVWRRVERLQARQRALLASDTQFLLVLDEATLGRETTAPAVMRDQLSHLARMTQHHRNISVRILPLKLRLPHVADTPRCDFTVYRWPEAEDPVVVVVETLTEALLQHHSDAIAPYLRLIDDLQSLTLSDADSARLLTIAAKAIGG